jgi:AraC-like DNA-binding protein
MSDRVSFNHAVDRLIFPADVLDLPLQNADPIAAQLARNECERELAAIAHAGLEGRVRAVVVDALAANTVPKLPAVARLLHISARTLKRHLADHGSAFSTILADVRRQRALLLLANRDLAISEVATRLGYTELPNFTRAFRAWTGITPASYRARLAASR